MRTASLTSFFVTLTLLCGCSLLPQWRVFQAKIDPELAARSPAQIEAEREAAQFLEVKSANIEPNAPSQLAAIHTVAASLSSSLGEPKRTITPSANDQAKVIDGLRQGLLAEQKKAEQWRAFAKKYAGKPLEDTGINLAGPAGVLALVGIIAACIACPALGYIVLRVLPLLWGFFRRTTAAIDDFTSAHQDAGEQLKATLSRRMDEAHKALVRRRKKVPA